MYNVLPIPLLFCQITLNQRLHVEKVLQQFLPESLVHHEFGSKLNFLRGKNTKLFNNFNLQLSNDNNNLASYELRGYNSRVCDPTLHRASGRDSSFQSQFWIHEFLALGMEHFAYFLCRIVFNFEAQF